MVTLEEGCCERHVMLMGAGISDKEEDSQHEKNILKADVRTCLEVELNGEEEGHRLGTGRGGSVIDKEGEGESSVTSLDNDVHGVRFWGEDWPRGRSAPLSFGTRDQDRGDRQRLGKVPARWKEAFFGTVVGWLSVEEDGIEEEDDDDTLETRGRGRGDERASTGTQSSSDVVGDRVDGGLRMPKKPRMSEHLPELERPSSMLKRQISLAKELDTALEVHEKRRAVWNFINVPLQLERLVLLGFCVCADEFLSLFTELPVRCALGAGKTLWMGAKASAASHSRSPQSKDVRKQFLKTLANWTVDIVHCVIFVLAVCALSFFDTSRIYHGIRGQNVVKLYVVVNVLEIFDKLCCSFGADLFDGLGLSIYDAVAHRENTRSFSWIIARSVALEVALAIIYAVIHSVVLLSWVVTLNVAMNSQNNMLLTLLVSNNFVELKGSVLKSSKVQTLFQTSCGDVVERFQLSIFMTIIIIYSLGDIRLVTTWLVVLISEVVVDWIKHAFISKFNLISCTSYSKFMIILCDDILQARKYTISKSIGGSSVAKRVRWESVREGTYSQPQGEIVSLYNLTTTARSRYNPSWGIDD